MENHQRASFLEITEEVAAILRRFLGFELFDPKLHVLRNIKPGLGINIAPRCFSIKLKRTTHDGFGAKSTTHDPQLIAKHETGHLVLIGIVHFDNIKVAYGDERVFLSLIKELAKRSAKARSRLSTKTLHVMVCSTHR